VSLKVLLLNENAPLHTALLTVETITKLGCEVLQHPAYTPELAPSDFHIFGHLKNAFHLISFQ